MGLQKAIITNTNSGEAIPVQFNPEEYTVSKDNNFAQTAVPGLSGPILQFVSGNMATLDMELLVDTYEEHREGDRLVNRAGEDVRKLTREITDLMTIDPKTHAPPVLTFTAVASPSYHQPGFVSFTCVLSRASQRFIMFALDGTPLRARLQVTFQEYTNGELEAKEIKRETSDFSHIYEVGQGETLSAIAGRILGNPRSWRAIARRNGVENPRRLEAGTRLIIPKLPYRDPATGEVHR